jgi:soluble lytic murein transglycosylase-like protein
MAEIDSLVVSLGLDPKDFTQGAQKASEALSRLTTDQQAKLDAFYAHTKQSAQTAARTQDTLDSQAQRKQSRQLAVKQQDDRKAVRQSEENAGRLGEALGKVTGAALEMFGALTAGKGLADFVAQTATANANLQLIATNLGVLPSKVAGLGLALKTKGGSVDDATAGLGTIVSDQQKIALSQPIPGASLFIRAGVTGDDFKNPEVVLDKLSDEMKKLGPSMSMELGQAAGLPPSLINLMEGGSKSFEAAWAKGNADAPTQKDFDADTQLRAAFVNAENDFAKAGNNLVTKLAPFLQQFIAILDRFAKWSQANPIAGAAATAAGGVAAAKAAAWGLKKVLRIGGGAAASGGETLVGGLLRSTVSAALPLAAEAALPAAILFTPSSLGRDGTGQSKPLAPDVEAEVRSSAKNRGVDPELAVATLRQEGGGYNNVSPAGAFGPAQLMPGTAADLGVATSPTDPNYSWQKNADAGVKYLGQMLARYHGDRVRALAAYNWGPGNVDKWDGKISELPAETQAYVTRILSHTDQPAGLSGSTAAPSDVASDLTKLVKRITAGDPAQDPHLATGGPVPGAPKPNLTNPHAGMYQSAITGQWTKNDSLATGVKVVTNPTAANHSGWWRGYDGWHKIADTGQGLVPDNGYAASLHAGTSADAMHGSDARGNKSVTNNHSVTTGDLHVHTAATDANGIAKGLAAAVTRQNWITSSNSGLA